MKFEFGDLCDGSYLGSDRDNSLGFFFKVWGLWRFQGLRDWKREIRNVLMGNLGDYLPRRNNIYLTLHLIDFLFIKVVNKNFQAESEGKNFWTLLGCKAWEFLLVAKKNFVLHSKSDIAYPRIRGGFWKS